MALHLVVRNPANVAPSFDGVNFIIVDGADEADALDAAKTNLPSEGASAWDDAEVYPISSVVFMKGRMNDPAFDLSTSGGL